MAAESKFIIRAVDKFSKVLEDFKRKSSKSSKSMEDFGKKMKGFGKKMTLMTAPLAAFGALSVKAAAQNESLGISFERMTADVGMSGDNLIASLKAASANTVSNNDLMLASNKAMSLGVGKDLEGMTKLMEVARLKGRDMGITTTQAFDDIVTGIGRGSPLILDNLGITVKIGEANENYAKSIGKTVAELTAAEKQQALLNAVMVSAEEDLKSAGELQETNAEKMERFKASVENLQVAIGEKLLPALIPVIEKVSEWINKFSEASPETQKFVTMIGGAAVAAGPLMIALGGVTRGLGLLVGGVGKVSTPIGALITVLVLFFTKTELGQKLLKGLTDQFNKLASGAKATIEVLKKGKEGIEASQGAQEKLQVAVKNTTGAHKELNERLITLEKKQEEYYKSVKSGSGDAMHQAREDMLGAAKGVSEFMKTNSKALDKASVDYSNFSKKSLGSIAQVDTGVAKHIKNVQTGSDETASSLSEAIGAFAGYEVEASSSIQNVAATAGKMQEPAQQSATWGSHLLSNFIAGINSMIPGLGTVIGNVVGKVNALKFSTNPLMPTEIYGEHMIQNFASGAIKATPKVQAAMGNVITIVNAFGQEVKVGINDTAAVFDAYSEKVEETAKSHEDLASEAGKAMGEMTREIDKGVQEASVVLRDLQQQLSDIFGEFGEKESASKQKFAQAVVENEAKMAELRKEIVNEEDNQKRLRLASELEREQAAREANLELIKSVEKEAGEIRRFNNLTRLQQSVEVFKKEREENKKWLQDRLDGYNKELTAAQEKLPQIQELWEERKNLLTQFMGEEADKSDQLNASLDESAKMVGFLISQLNALERKAEGMNISVSSLVPKNARATGGPVSSNSSYLVGERGPEIFTPNQGGNITPNSAMGGGVTININGPVSSEEAAEEMMDIVVRRLQQHVKVV